MNKKKAGGNGTNPRILPREENGITSPAITTRIVVIVSG